MEIERKFVGYSEPLLRSAAGFLVRNFGFDLQNLSIAVTSRRAGRRLIEILLSHSEEAGELLIPPRHLFSIGELPEQFYMSNMSFASTVERHLAWKIALSNTENGWLQPLTKNTERLTPSNQLTLAQKLDAIWSEISATGKSFAEVAIEIEQLTEFEEQERWKAFDQIFNCYLERLSEVSLCDKNKARIDVLASGEKLVVHGQLILLGVAELSDLSKGFLKKAVGKAISLIQAPLEESESFDEFGCIINEKWLEKKCPIDNSQIFIGEQPADQVHHSLAFLEKSGANRALDEITIGVTDSKLIPVAIEEFTKASCPIRSAEGSPLIESSPFRLLTLLISYAVFRKVSDFAVLLRHSDFSLHLSFLEGTHRTASQQITLLDRFIENHLPEKVGTILELVTEHEELSLLINYIDQLVSGIESRDKPLALWIEIFSKLLDEVYNSLSERDDYNFDSCQLFAEGLAEVAGAKLFLGEEGCDPFFALQLISRAIEGRVIPNEVRDVSAELLGWLELALDDAPVVFVLGFNEGRVPETINADPFLPNNLRIHLGLGSNETRYARDMYILTILANSCEKFGLSYGKRSEKGELLLPSRLLLATTKEDRAERILRFCGVLDVDDKQEASNPHSYLEQSNLGFPLRPDPSSILLPKSLSVSAYQAYLACPYRFYLGQLLKLKRVDDSYHEMPPQLFGTLAHSILSKFATSAVAASSNEKSIEKALKELLDEELRNQFGSSIRPTIALQGELLQLRFSAFAKKQSAWRTDGWLIKEVELDLKKEEHFRLAGNEPLGVHGRIDRLDYNEKTGEWAILDYKTGEQPHKLKTHFNQEWRSVQLPLYYLLAQEKLSIQKLHLGFVNLVRNSEAINFEVAPYSQQEIESGLILAEQSARGILERNFWPPSDLNYTDEFADICSSSMFSEVEDDEVGIDE